MYHRLAAVLLLVSLCPATSLARSHRGGGWLSSGETWLDFHDDTPRPKPSEAQQQDGFIPFRRSVLERIYSTSWPQPGQEVGTVDLQAARGEYEAAQVGVYALRDLKQLQVTVSDLEDGAHHVIPSASIVVRMERYYGVRLSIRVKDRFGVVPKTLEVAVPIDVPAGTTRPYWITVHVPDEQPGGLYRGSIAFAHEGRRTSLAITVEVVPIKLLEADVLYGMLSMNALAHAGRALEREGIDGSQEISEALNDRRGSRAGLLVQEADLMVADQREHGMTTFNPRSDDTYRERDGHPDLPDLELGMELYRKYHFPQPMVYFPVNLLKTNKINRSWNYKQYDPAVDIPMARKIAAYYTQRFRDAGLPGIVFVPVEEPNLRSGVSRLDAPDTRQKIAHELNRAMKEAGGTMAMTCTPESVKCAMEYLTYWIMAFKRFTPRVYEMAKQAGAKLCIYANGTVMGQGTYFPRFLFGYFVWANQLKGMLPWTYPLQPNHFPRNPGHRAEGGLNVRDGFIGLDGKPIPTIQWELCREGIDDARYLVTIESLIPQARARGTSAAGRAADDAERLLAEIRAGVGRDVTQYSFEDPQTFEPRPSGGWDAARFEATRRRSFTVLQELLAVS